jgi:heme/copper-type cytochrome/quinol oxidase subunit 1
METPMSEHSEPLPQQVTINDYHYVLGLEMVLVFRSLVLGWDPVKRNRDKSESGMSWFFWSFFLIYTQQTHQDIK